MNTNAPELTIDLLDAGNVAELRSELLMAYADAYGERLNDPFATEERYAERLSGYASRNGFSLATGRVDGVLVGYCYGFTLPVGARWWRGFVGEADYDFFTENGRRTFALVDIAVRPLWRRRGYARALHDVLLTNRKEERA